MNVLSYLLCAALLAVPVLAQSSKLPEALLPDIQAVSLDSGEDHAVIKLLPRGHFGKQAESYKDEDSLIGIRGDGAYFSFTSQHHSYNKIPQVQLANGRFSVGFYGANYGLMKDLGKISLSEVSDENNYAQELKAYKPPKVEAEARAEARKFRAKNGDSPFKDKLPAILDHTYLLRAISFGEADILVAFTVASLNNDGSVNLIWKKIADLEKPILLRQSDDELSEKIKIVLQDSNFAGVKFSVKDNVVRLTGNISKQHLAILMQKVSQAGPTKIENLLNGYYELMGQPAF